jgi:hypothetical protein
MRVVWLFVAAVVLVAACSPGATPYRELNLPKPRPASPSPSVRAATAAEVKRTAGAFAKATSAFNRTIDAANKRRGGDSSYDAVTAYYADLAKAEATFRKALDRKALDRIDFPDEFAQLAKTLTDAVTAARERDLRAAQARDPQDLLNLAVRAKSAEHHAAEAAAALREALGLRPAK